MSRNYRGRDCQNHRLPKRRGLCRHSCRRRPHASTAAATSPATPHLEPLLPRPAPQSLPKRTSSARAPPLGCLPPRVGQGRCQMPPLVQESHQRGRSFRRREGRRIAATAAAATAGATAAATAVDTTTADRGRLLPRLGQTAKGRSSSRSLWHGRPLPQSVPRPPPRRPSPSRPPPNVGWLPSRVGRDATAAGPSVVGTTAPRRRPVCWGRRCSAVARQSRGGARSALLDACQREPRPPPDPRSERGARGCSRSRCHRGRNSGCRRRGRRRRRCRNVAPPPPLETSEPRARSQLPRPLPRARRWPRRPRPPLPPSPRRPFSLPLHRPFANVPDPPVRPAPSPKHALALSFPPLSRTSPRPAHHWPLERACTAMGDAAGRLRGALPRPSCLSPTPSLHRQPLAIEKGREGGAATAATGEGPRTPLPVTGDARQECTVKTRRLIAPHSVRRTFCGGCCLGRCPGDSALSPPTTRRRVQEQEGGARKQGKWHNLREKVGRRSKLTFC